MSVDIIDGKHKEARDKGRLVVFEGGHGSGKTLQAGMLIKSLQSNEIRARYTKEPYGSDMIPLIQKHANGDVLASPVLMYLLAASRYIHVRDIKSWIFEGDFVICDRYVLSSFVYQQIQGMPLNLIKRINSFAITPSITFYVHVSLKERLKRLRKARRNRNNFFLQENRLAEEQELYDGLTNNWNEKHYGKLAIVNGEAEPAEVHEKITKILVAEAKIKLLANPYG
jgi:dTMP kinase